MIDYILSGDGTFNNLSLLIDNDGIIPQTASVEKNSRTILFAETSIELRLLFDAHIRDMDDGSSSAEYINFSHPDLSMTIYRLIANAKMPHPELPEQLTRIELEPEDQWILLLYPHGHPDSQGENSSSAQKDPEIIAQLEKIRNIAQVDQESFLMKTRKTMESIVNDLLTSEDRAAASYTLFEKLKYLEDRSRLPKTTATFFHTIRKLGNLGAHEARGILNEVFR